MTRPPNPVSPVSLCIPCDCHAYGIGCLRKMDEWLSDDYDEPGEEGYPAEMWALVCKEAE